MLCILKYTRKVTGNTWSVPFLIQDGGCLWRREVSTGEGKTGFSAAWAIFFRFGMHSQGFTDFLIMSCFRHFSLRKSDQTCNIKFQGRERCRLNAEPAAEAPGRAVAGELPATRPPTVEQRVDFMRALRIPQC